MRGMTLSPAARKANFLTHVAASVGWMGSVVAYLALAVGGLAGKDPALARSAYLAMEFIGWSVIVPLSLAALLTGLIQSLGTEWGLFRHYWILAKFLIASVGSLILLFHMRVVGQMSGVARGTSFSTDGFGDLRIQIVVHASGGLLILMTAMVLSVYKPLGRTPYGRRMLEEPPAPPQATAAGSTRRARKTMYLLFGIIVVGVLLLLLHHLSGGGPRHH